MTEITYIVATRALKCGGTAYELADKFPLDEHMAKGHLDQRVATYVKDVEQIVPLTRAHYERLIIQRPNGTIPRGFTLAELVERGIVDKPVEKPKDRAAASKSSKAAAAEKPQSAPEPKVPALETIAYKDQVIVPVKQGNLTKYEVKNKEGALLREQRFAKVDTAKRFIDGLAPAPEPDTSGAAPGQEKNDGGNLQSESRDAA